MRRYFSVLNILDLFKIPIGLCQALWHLFALMPDVVFSKGGYGSAPVVLIAWLYRIPILVHESDTVPGLANRLAGKFSQRVAVSFASAEKYFPSSKTALVGNPIRSDILQTCLSTNLEDKEKARTLLQIVSQKPILFILGGSQGSQKLNELTLLVLPRLLEKYEVIHQCGEGNIKQIKQFFNNSLPKNYHLFSFLDKELYGAALLLSDLIISRSGSTIFEIAACGKPSILVPLPGSAAEHQRENAFTYARAGAGTVLEQANLTPHLFLNEIDKILNDAQAIQQMSQNARNFAQPEAARKIAKELIEMVE
jgi:UDP-N-acetylglucosamine--N-acetylmuramyl-(pentapeptide) pyrophosphoryl-undecaprenol N-acetylglucosamine transferase